MQGVDMQSLNEALTAANVSPVALTCDCRNGAICRQRVRLQPETVYTIATDVTSFVAPGHSHQLYCACNLGFAGRSGQQIVESLLVLQLFGTDITHTTWETNQLLSA